MNGKAELVKYAVQLSIVVLGVYIGIITAHSDLKERVTVVEHQLGEELKGYRILVSDLGTRISNINERLSRIEGKLDIH